MLRSEPLLAGLGAAFAGYLVLFAVLFAVPLVLGARGVPAAVTRLALTALPAGFAAAAVGSSLLPGRLPMRLRGSPAWGQPPRRCWCWPRCQGLPPAGLAGVLLACGLEWAVHPRQQRRGDGRGPGQPVGGAGRCAQHQPRPGHRHGRGGDHLDPASGGRRAWSAETGRVGARGDCRVWCRAQHPPPAGGTRREPAATRAAHDDGSALRSLPGRAERTGTGRYCSIGYGQIPRWVS